MENEDQQEQSPVKQSPVKQTPKVIMIWHLGTGVLIDGAFAELHGLRFGQYINSEEELFNIIRKHSATQMDKMNMIIDSKQNHN